MRIIGQGQLIRRQIAFLLQFNCQMDAHLLYQSLDTFNHTLMNEIRRHYHEPEKYSYPSSDNMILYETMVLMMVEDKNDDGESDDDDDLYSIYLFIDLYLLCRYYWRHQGWKIQCRKYM
jgi:hypothetical protein